MGKEVSALSGSGSTGRAGKARGRELLLGLVILAFCFAPAYAQRLPITHYGSDDGLAASQVWDIHRDRRGYLWLATTGGLSRYDGVGFRNLTARNGLLNQVVRTISEDQDGTLWLGTNQGVTRYDGRSLRHFSTADGLGAGIVWASAIDGFGHLWFGTAGGGVSVYRDHRFRSFTREDGLPCDYVYSLLSDTQGFLWLGSRSHGVTRCRVEAEGRIGECVTYTTADGLAHDSVRAMAEDPAGNLYFATLGGGLSRYDGTSFTTVLPETFVFDLIINHRNELVAATRSGVYICPLPDMAPCRRVGKINGLLTNNVWSLYEDREHILWIGQNNGLGKLPGEAFRSYSDQDGLPDSAVTAVHADPGGDVWIGTFNGLARLRNPSDRYGEGQLDLWTADRGLGCRQVWEVYRDRSGVLWLGTDEGLCRFREEEGCTFFGEEHGLAGSYVVEITEDHLGRLWLGTPLGISCLEQRPRDGNIEFTTYTPQDGLATGTAHEIIEDHSGRIWVGTYGGGLSISQGEGETFKTYTTRDGLPNDSIVALHVSADTVVWIGTAGGGLASATLGEDKSPRFRTWDILPASVLAIRDAGEGRLWVSTMGGVYLFDPAGGGEIIQHLDRATGLLSNEGTTGNSIAIDREGRIWFGSTSGITRYDPRLFESELSPPPVSLEGMQTGSGRAWVGEFLAPGEALLGSGQVLPWSENNLRLDFRGLSFRSEEDIRFQVQLEGFDPDWSKPFAEPFKEYTNLDPGQYRFQVRAATEGDRWGPPATLTFAIAPAFWQTRTFIFLLVLLGALLVFAVHKRRTHRIRARAEELERVVQERTDDLRRYAEALQEHSQALDTANAEIVRANRFKTEFLANMSHELRTPLNSILGFAQVLSRSPGLGQDQQHRFFGNILSSGHHLLNLINTLLDISKIEAGKMELCLEQAKVETVLGEVCDVMAGYSRELEVAIESRIEADLPRVTVDIAKLKQILFNLLSNAMKSSPEGATVDLEAKAVNASVSALAVDSFQVAVRDRGAGIPAEMQETIFQEFRQLSREENRQVGTGLGLALVQRLLGIMGGTVAVESTPGQGATFRVLLPVTAIEGSKVDPAEQVGAAQPKRPRVLVVEEHKDTFVVLARALEKQGFPVVRAHSGEEAVRMAREIRPALVTLDFSIPGIDGWAVLWALKADPATAHLPVVFLSVAPGGNLDFALAVDDYLAKPLNGEEVVRRVGALANGAAGPVLVIDHDLPVRDLLTESLGAAGFDVLTASDGTQGLALTAANQPVAIVLDLLMPGMTGFEVVQRLRKEKRTASIPVLGCSAKELSLADRRRLTSQVTATCGTADVSDLIGTIRQLLERRRKAER